MLLTMREATTKMADSEKPPEHPGDFPADLTEAERAFLETYAMLLRLIFRAGLAPTGRDEAA